MFDYIKRIEKWERRVDSLEIFLYFSITFFLIICNTFIFKKHPIPLTENQILYIFSVIAQVIGTFIGVSIAGYTLLDSRNNSSDDIDDDGFKELQKSIANNQFRWLIRIIVYGLTAIILCLFSISLYDKSPSYLFNIISSETIAILILFIYILMKFTLFLSPKAISKQSDIMKMNMDKEYPDTTTSTTTFGDYVTKYNQLENILYCLVEELDKGCSYHVASTLPHKRGFIYSCRILREMGIFNNPTIKILDDIRQYRNVLVHGTEDNKSVNEEIYKKLTQIFDLLKALLDYARNNPKEDILKSRPYFTLVKYSIDNVLSDLEEKEIANIQLMIKHSKNKELSKSQLKKMQTIVNNGLLDELYSNGKLSKNEYNSIRSAVNRK